MSSPVVSSTWATTQMSANGSLPLVWALLLELRWSSASAMHWSKLRRCGPLAVSRMRPALSAALLVVSSVWPLPLSALACFLSVS